MLPTYLQILTTVFAGARARLERTRARDRQRDARAGRHRPGSLVATAVAAIITNAIMSRANQIS